MKKLEKFGGGTDYQSYLIHPDFWDDILLIESMAGTLNITNVRGYCYYLTKTQAIIDRLEEKGIINKGDITL